MSVHEAGHDQTAEGVPFALDLRGLRHRADPLDSSIEDIEGSVCDDLEVGATCDSYICEVPLHTCCHICSPNLAISDRRVSRAGRLPYL
jgi:hypothetical protein